MRAFLDWVGSSVRNADNFPHYLIAIFTFALTIFAYYAWSESQQTTAALEGQLLAIQTDQRPLMWLTGARGPTYRDESGQVTWNWIFSNIGKGIAYRLTAEHYIKIGNENFQKSRGQGLDVIESPPFKPRTVPPNITEYGTVYSRAGINKDYFQKMLATDFGIGLLVGFRYTDASGNISFSNSVCLERLANGATADRPIEDCPKQ